MYTFILFSLISAALFYLGARALITSWLWSRYPAKLTTFMDCAACTGFWWGVGLALVHPFGMSYLGADLHRWWAPVFVGLCSLVMTPIAAGFMQRGLDALGHVEP